MARPPRVLPLSWFLAVVLGRGLIGLLEGTLIASIFAVAAQNLRFSWLTRRSVPGEHVRRLLDQAPSLVRQKAGPQQWEPLLFLCYARLPNEKTRENSVAIGEALLDAGADPNAYTTDGHNHFTAFCGVVGRGETRQPEHPRAKDLGRLLLERGARVDQGQALYNEHLHVDDDSWLKLLFEFGLDAATPFNCTGDDTAPPAFDYLLPLQR